MGDLGDRLFLEAVLDVGVGRHLGLLARPAPPLPHQDAVVVDLADELHVWVPPERLGVELASVRQHHGSEEGGDADSHL